MLESHSFSLQDSRPQAPGELRRHRELSDFPRRTGRGAGALEMDGDKQAGNGRFTVENQPFLMCESTISMAMASIAMFVYKRVYIYIYEVVPQFVNIYTRWCPSLLAKLVYNSNNLGLW